LRAAQFTKPNMARAKIGTAHSSYAQLFLPKQLPVFSVTSVFSVLKALPNAGKSF